MIKNIYKHLSVFPLFYLCALPLIGCGKKSDQPISRNNGGIDSLSGSTVADAPGNPGSVQVGPANSSDVNGSNPPERELSKGLKDDSTPDGKKDLKDDSTPEGKLDKALKDLATTEPEWAKILQDIATIDAELAYALVILFITPDLFYAIATTDPELVKKMEESSSGGPTKFVQACVNLAANRELIKDLANLTTTNSGQLADTNGNRELVLKLWRNLVANLNSGLDVL